MFIFVFSELGLSPEFTDALCMDYLSPDTGSDICLDPVCVTLMSQCISGHAMLTGAGHMVLLSDVMRCV